LTIPALCLSARAGVVRKVGMVDQASRALGFALAAAALAAVVGGPHVSSAVDRVNLSAVVVTSYVLTFVRVGPASIRGAYELGAGVKAADCVVVGVTRLFVSTAFARTVEIICEDAVR
jgi:small basic protein